LKYLATELSVADFVFCYTGIEKMICLHSHAAISMGCSATRAAIATWQFYA